MLLSCRRHLRIPERLRRALLAKLNHYQTSRPLCGFEMAEMHVRSLNFVFDSDVTIMDASTTTPSQHGGRLSSWVKSSATRKQSLDKYCAKLSVGFLQTGHVLVLSTNSR